jgi:hypothetical protein
MPDHPSAKPLQKKKKISIVIAESQASCTAHDVDRFSSICLPSILPPTAGTPAAS